LKTLSGESAGRSDCGSEEVDPTDWSFEVRFFNALLELVEDL